MNEMYLMVKEIEHTISSVTLRETINLSFSIDYNEIFTYLWKNIYELIHLAIATYSNNM